MAAYHQVDKTWQLYQECREKDIPLDTGTYNAIIRVAAFLRDAPELRWQLVKEILSALGDSGAQPDLGTLNATLEALSHAAGWRQAREVSLQVLVEFGQLGIKPSLATYYHLLTIHCRERGPRSQVLLDILDYCEGHLFTLQDTKDVFFFVTAMDVARNHLRSLEAARRIHAMLQHGDNHLLIGDSYKESVYYRHFFAVSCQTLPVDEFMGEVYSLLVPHVYTPEPGIMQEVIETMRVSGSLHHLPQLWTDVFFHHSSAEDYTQ
ncbi:Protein PTCD3, mitochondrial [Chionoecetes opilio]|uniref:Small ribosomal subunit protein mS39 n=1 Tax=Chionoecetes opilio TaxID=41210 RepID=A0A8J5CLS1_CHIOP|nr:Protein PTCD3, mitochondrial [Chionoecetes opilio]